MKTFVLPLPCIRTELGAPYPHEDAVNQACRARTRVRGAREVHNNDAFTAKLRLVSTCLWSWHAMVLSDGLLTDHSPVVVVAKCGLQGQFSFIVKINGHLHIILSLPPVDSCPQWWRHHGRSYGVLGTSCRNISLVRAALSVPLFLST